MYALGATLVFAATGHPPYQGDSVMDVLSRLATEEPDLAGLPGELTGLVTACLQRVPRERPTSSAVLARLGQFTETGAGAAGEHSYLPDEAMALIAQYQRNPLLASAQPVPEDGGDATSASYTELPASYQPKPRRQPARPGWRPWVRAHLAWVGWVSVGAALVVGGVILGASLTSSGSPGAGLPPPVAPATVCGTRDVASQMLCMNRSQGDPSATFIVEGKDFPPGQQVTVMLSEIGPPPAWPSRGAKRPGPAGGSGSEPTWPGSAGSRSAPPWWWAASSSGRPSPVRATSCPHRWRRIPYAAPRTWPATSCA